MQNSARTLRQLLSLQQPNLLVFFLTSPPQTASLLSAVPAALEECVHSVPDPPHLRTVLAYHTTLGHFDLSGESVFSASVLCVLF